VFCDKKEYDKAIADYNFALEVDPTNINALRLRGVAYGSEEKYESAINDYTQVIEINQNDIEARKYLCYMHYLQGNKNYEKGKLDNAIVNFTQVIKTDPVNASAYQGRACAYYVKKEYDKTWEDINKAKNLGCQIENEFIEALAAAYVNRGIDYSQKEELSQAISDYTQAITINPKLAIAYNNRGCVYLKKEEYEKAILDCSKALELDSRCGVAYETRAEVYYKKGEYDKAQSDANKAQSLGLQINSEFLECLKKKVDKNV